MRNGEYELIVAPLEYPGKKYRDKYCYEHHLVWWKNTGELIIANKTAIRHKDNDKRNNKFGNLKKVTVKEHNNIHCKPPAMMKLVCAYCKKEFEREKRNVIYKIMRGQEDFYCNRTCMAKHFGRSRPKKHSLVAQ